MIEPEHKIVRSKHYSSRGSAQIRLLVIHSAECSEVKTAAEALATWGGSAKGSWHVACDNDSITVSVPDVFKAFHAGRVNAYSIGIEQAGKASQTAEQWDDEYSRGVIQNTARVVAWKSKIHGIPLRFVDAAELFKQHMVGGAWGVTTHAECSKAFSVTGGHWDPGPNYPMNRMLELAEEILAND